MDNTNEQEKQIKELEERANNYALLDAKDGFFITTAYPGQIISDYVVEGGVTTKTLLAADLPFFIARQPCEVLWVAESHIVAGTDAGSVTMDIVKLTSGQAVASGVSILTTEFDMKSTANTPVQKEGKDLSANRQLKNGDRLALDFTGTLTDLAGVQVTLYLKNLARGHYK
jgi:hypothetical protein